MSAADSAIAAEKRALRSAMQRALRTVAPDWHARASRAAADAVVQAPWFTPARTMFAFVSLPREIDTGPLLRAILEHGKRLAVPRAQPATGSLEAIAIDDPSDLAPGAFGVREPRGGEAIDLASVDVAIVPGLAFDARGGRLGRGGGFYDRCLGMHPGLLTCGLAFALQIVERVPVQAFDQRVQWLASELGVAPTAAIR